MATRKRKPRQVRRPNPAAAFEIDINAFLREAFSGFFVKPAVTTLTIPDDLLRKMIFLCHPDKHANNPIATEVTQWLLSQRQQQK